MSGANLTDEVTTTSPYVVPAVGATRFTVAAIDLGIKRMTPIRLAERGIEVHVLPAGGSGTDVLVAGADGVFLSNGPGDPATAQRSISLTRELLARGTPLFGICFGNQILGRALGLDTYKLRYGHRGGNRPGDERAAGGA